MFLSIGMGLFVFTFFPEILNALGRLFGLQRWADLLVYCAIIFLIYFSLLLLNKIEENRADFTKLVRELALYHSWKKILKGKYVFIIPAYNEWKVIYKNIKQILEKYKNIIVINDGSQDNTAEELIRFGNDIIYLEHFKNRGQWAALETWFEYVRKFCDVEFVITFDSDGQHKLEDIMKFEEAFQDDIDVYLWSRFQWDAKNISFSRKLVLKLGILFTFFISNIKLSDTHNGFRILRKNSLYIIKITIDGMWHASEIIDIISNNNMKFKEVPVTIEYSEYSKGKWQTSTNALSIAFTMIWNKFFK